MDTYLSIRCVIPAELEEELPELLAPWPVLGTDIGEVSDHGLRITVFFSAADFRTVDCVSSLLSEQGAIEIERELVEADDWMARYRSQVQPFAVGETWWIDPQPDRPTAAPLGRKRLAIEPRMAFGTGSHESTRAILVALEEIDVARLRVLDVGTGSGILALAAERSGAKSVVALDIDDTAVWVAVETARQQDWEPCVGFVVGPVACLGNVEFDIVLCNMIAANFLPLVAELRNLLAPRGVVVFSGMLASDVEAVSESLESAGLSVLSENGLGEWVSMLATRATAR